MAKETLQKYLNRMLKSKGKSATEEKKKAKKYSSISAAKKAGSLYYTNKDGKVMAAVFAGDLKEDKPTRPVTKPPVTKKSPQSGSGRGSGSSELQKRRTDIESPTSAARRGALRREGYKDLSEMMAAGSQVPGLMPKGIAAKAKRREANKGDKAAERSRAKRYTKDQWKDMNPTRRRELGLPRSSMGVTFKTVKPRTRSDAAKDNR